MKLEITSRKFIIPSSPTPPHLQKLKISCFDQQFPDRYVPCIFYYAANNNEYVVSNEESSLQLQKSLSEILTLYYPLAGRYAKDDEPLIECNDKGVEYLEAKIDGSLSQLLSDKDLEIELQKNHPLVPQKFDPNNSSLLVVQFNVFECGGIALGTAMSHKIADAATAFSFFQAWATASRIGVEKLQHYPSFELGSIFPPRDVPRKENLFVTKTISNKIVTKKFVFDRVAISNLRKATTRNGRNQATRVKVVTALIWRSLMRVAKARHGQMRPSILKIPLGLRGKTGVPVPENCTGNFVSRAAVQFTPSDDEICCEVELHDLVSQIHDGVENLLSKYAEVSDPDELFSMVMDDMSKVSQAVKESDVDVYMFSCWCRFPIFEADFGWGEPSMVNRNVQAEREMISLLDTKEGDGIEAWIGLEEKSMLLFEQDPDIRAFTC